GNDTYVFNLGDGHDTIYDYDRNYTNYSYYNAGNDTIRFGEGIDESSVAFYMNGSNLVLSYGDNDLITITNQSVTNNAIEKFTLSDGNYLTSNDINVIIQSMNAYATDHGITIDSMDTVKNNQDLMNIVAAGWHQ
ncbi:calcium-binding protein, partial [Sulfuricurvum sp.]|uniref:calcium-binding protein n=1 Tax=Sulfuricurvum sp. TaxID=2025608 RepID=UPI002607EA27